MDTSYLMFPIACYLVFGLVGAATLWILLRWSNRPVNIMDLARGAGSWILAPLIGSFVSGLIMRSIGMESTALVVIIGFLIGFVAAIATALSLRLAGLTLSKTLIMASGVTWGIGFAMILGIQFRNWNYGDWYGMLDFSNWILLPATGIAGFTVMAIGLEKRRVNGLSP